MIVECIPAILIIIIHFTMHACDRMKRYLGPVLLHFLKDAFTGRGAVGESHNMT